VLSVLPFLPFSYFLHLAFLPLVRLFHFIPPEIKKKVNELGERNEKYIARGTIVDKTVGKGKGRKKKR